MICTRTPTPMAKYPVGLQNSATGPELASYAARSYSLMTKTPRFRCHLSGFRHVSNDPLALAFPVPTWRLSRHLFPIAHHDGLQPAQHEAV